MMKIGNICTIQMGNSISRRNNIIDNIPVYGSGTSSLYYTNEANRSGITCKISKVACPKIMMLNENYYLDNTAFTIESNNHTLLTNKYLWFYLINNQHIIEYTGTTISNINMEDFLNIEIPVPSIIRQGEITKNSLSPNIIQIQNQNYYILGKIE